MVDQAVTFMREGRFDEALPLLEAALDRDGADWNLRYLAGQCARFLGDLDGAVRHLTGAVALRDDEPEIHLALGIAHQLAERWDHAVGALLRAIELDRNYHLAYNSLALTQRKRGELEKAAHNYDAGAKALARGKVESLENIPSSPLLKHRDTRGRLWVDHAIHAAFDLAGRAEGVTSVGFPTGEQAAREEHNERHAGLYWVDRPTDDGRTVRHFLPNYFNTLREQFRQDPAYANLLGNRARVLELLGRTDEALIHLAEAMEFGGGAGAAGEAGEP